MSDFEFNCPHCKQLLEAPEDMRGRAIECPACQGSIQIPIDPLNVPTQGTIESHRELSTVWFKRNPGRVRGITFVVAGGILAVLIACLTWRSIAPPTWVTISYGELLDRDAIIRTGQDLGSALRDGNLRNAIQPFVDGYSQLLPVAIEFTKGPDQTPCHSILDFFPSGERQPAWVAIFRGGRIHIVTDDKNHAKVFLLGVDPKQAYFQNYSVVRHCLGMLSRLANGSVNVDVFAYHNDYTNSELRLNTKPYSFRSNAFGPRKPVVDLDALSVFFAEGPEIQGATLNEDQGLVLYGSECPKQTLAGHPIELSDLAVAYRAVFHAGDNDAFISLDPNKDPTKVTVNFGGFLENTRIGSVVLEADKRFKTITSGLDPNTFLDIRNYTRKHVPSFLSSAEYDLLTREQSTKGQWIGTRFWYYPDAIGVDSDLNWEYAVLANPRFTADAERSREDFASLEEFERKKRNTLSPSIRENIDDLNRNYVQYAQAFSEISELTTVARLMGICSWLIKAKPDGIDLDALLEVELPPCTTEVERTQLIAATFFSYPKAEMPDRDRIVADSTVVFLTPILDQTVDEFFQTPDNIVKYLSGEKQPTAANHAKFDSEATLLFSQYQNRKVRDILHSQLEVMLLAAYAATARTVDVPLPPMAINLEARITTDKTALASLESSLASLESSRENLDSSITQIKIRMLASPEAHNALVDRHNELVEQKNAVVEQYNAVVEQYNAVVEQKKTVVEQYKALDVQYPYILQITGGINLEPSKFAIRQNASSPSLIDFKSRTTKIRSRWTNIGESKKWIRSDSMAQGTLPVGLRAKLKDLTVTASQIKRWIKTDARDGSWKTAIRLDASRAREKSYDAQQQALQVAEFTAGQLQSLIIAQRDAKGRIVFRRSERLDVLAPQTPPIWALPNTRTAIGE